MTIGEAIVKMLADAKQTRVWLAREMGYTQGTPVANMISRDNITTDVLVTVCEKFGYTVVLQPQNDDKEAIVLEMSKPRVKKHAGNQYTTGKEVERRTKWDK